MSIPERDNFMKNRIKFLREKLDLSQKEMGLKLAIPLTTISKYETGIVKPSSEILSNIGKVFNVNLNWLLIGEGDMFTKGNIENFIPNQNSIDLDLELMKDIIKQTEKIFQEKKLDLSPEKKAELIILLYEEIKEGEMQKEKLDSKLLKFVKLAS